MQARIRSYSILFEEQGKACFQKKKKKKETVEKKL